MDARKSKKIFDALETFRIELPSWGFANTGTAEGWKPNEDLWTKCLMVSTSIQ